MDEQIFSETEYLLKKIHMPRNAYINRAVNFYNHCYRKNLIKKDLRADVRLLEEDTKAFLKDFELLEDLSE